MTWNTGVVRKKRSMTTQQRERIKRGYVNGLSTEEIAEFAEVSIAETEIFLASWCDQGCPGAWP